MCEVMSLSFDLNMHVCIHVCIHVFILVCMLHGFDVTETVYVKQFVFLILLQHLRDNTFFS